MTPTRADLAYEKRLLMAEFAIAQIQRDLGKLYDTREASSAHYLTAEKLNDMLRGMAWTGFVWLLRGGGMGAAIALLAKFLQNKP